MPTQAAQTITIRIHAVDGFRARRSFKTLKGAQAYAQSRVGQHPTVSGLGYAVSDDGVVTLRVSGCALADLFPGDAGAAREAAEYERVMADIIAAERAQHQANMDAAIAESRAAEEALRPRRCSGCRCSDWQLTRVGCDCGAEMARAAEAEGRVAVDSVWTCDIANPGVAPIWAVMVRAGGREWALCDHRALYATQAEAAKLAQKVRVRGSIDTSLWEPTTMSPAEREAYYGPAGSLWQWEEQEKAAGRW